MTAIESRNRPSVEILWEQSRHGARAGFGFRFQDAAATAAVTLCWAGRIQGNAIVPEGLDDFSIESLGAFIYVQTKSKVSGDATFSAAEIVAFLTAPAALGRREGASDNLVFQVILIDRVFEGASFHNWQHRISDESSLIQLLKPTIYARANDDPAITQRVLSGSTLITWNSPITLAATEIAKKRNVPLAAALSCAYRIMAMVGQRTDVNASVDYATRAKVTIGDVDRAIDATLNLIDSSAIDAAVRKGIVEHIDFGNPLNEPGYYLGVATQPGHVAAGLTMRRENVTGEIINALFNTRRILVTGPSGAGKSAAVLMAAFETRHACRWIQVRRFSPGDREDFLAFLSSQAPSNVSPIVLYVDDAGNRETATWDAALEASLMIPSVYLAVSARQENIAALKGLNHFKQIRLVLDDAFAEEMWGRLDAENSTTWSSWREPLERSNGLLLEYAHILTQGRRLHEVIGDQVHQRLAEKRDSEFEVLRLASAATSVGAGVSVSLLATHLNLPIVDCARALQRLVDEHLVRQIGHDTLEGLHELRSQCIFETCLALVPGSIDDLRREALAIVSSDGVRTLIAATMRLAQLDEKAVVDAINKRIQNSQEPALLIGALEGLKLAALDRDAEIFKGIADRYGLAPRFYFLITIVMLLREEKYTGSKLEILAKLRDEFEAKRSHDFRNDLLIAINVETFTAIAANINSASAAIALLRSLAGLLLGDKITSLREIVRTFRGAALEEIATLLAIAAELSSDFAREIVENLGGSRLLLDRLWNETPWALRPNLIKDESGSVELHADLLAVEPPLTTGADSVVFDYATRALALAPHAQSITSRPVLITGESITIKDFTPGLKSFGRENRSSQATITWNRLLLHAVALRYAASSITEVMQQRKGGLEIAARMFTMHADRRCRSRKITRRQNSELKALNLLEDIFPAIPMDRPEVVLSAAQMPNLSDPGAGLIADVAQVCLRFYDESVDGSMLAYDMERIAKTVKSCRVDPHWNYVDGPPNHVLDEIEGCADVLCGVFNAVGRETGIAPGLVFMPSHQLWAKGTGVSKAHERAEIQGERKIASLKFSLIKMFSSEEIQIRAMSARLNPEHSNHWPYKDICLLAHCESIVAYYQWFIKKSEALKAQANNVASLTVAPVIQNRVIAPLALKMHPIGAMPEDDFIKRWASHIQLGCFTSSTLEIFEEVFGNMLVAYAVPELLEKKAFLAIEQKHVEACSEKFQRALGKFKATVTVTTNEAVTSAVVFLDSLEQIFRAAQTNATNEKPAVEMARHALPGLTAEKRYGALFETLIALRLTLVQYDIDQASPKAA